MKIKILARGEKFMEDLDEKLYWVQNAFPSFEVSSLTVAGLFELADGDIVSIERTDQINDYGTFISFGSEGISHYPTDCSYAEATIEAEKPEGIFFT